MIEKRPVNLIGRGRIGAAVAGWLKGSDSHVLQSVIGRTGEWRPAPLTIDAAGPQALRAHGEALLSQGDLWSVGAAALIDDDLRVRLAEVAGRTGHELRLFTGWIAGPTLAPAGANARLHIEQQAPRLGPGPGLLISGSLCGAAKVTRTVPSSETHRAPTPACSHNARIPELRVNVWLGIATYD